jgi:hypothetical protein
MISDRSGKVDTSVGCLVEGDRILGLKRPRLAELNEIVGSYAIGSVHYAAAFHVSAHLHDMEAATPYMPPALTRIRVGAAINTIAAPIVLATCVLAVQGLANTFSEALDYYNNLPRS